MRRAQFALEFIIMVAIALMIGITFLAGSSIVLKDTSELQRLEALNGIGYLLQDEVILATTVEDGYRRKIVLPQRAGRFQYAINTSATSVSLRSGSVDIAYPLPEITGSFKKGTNIIAKDGAVVIS